MDQHDLKGFATPTTPRQRLRALMNNEAPGDALKVLFDNVDDLKRALKRKRPPVGWELDMLLMAVEVATAHARKACRAK
jgi:hypothetical protein